MVTLAVGGIVLLAGAGRSGLPAALQVLGLASVAGVGGVLATHGWLRRLVGVLVAGVGVVALALTVPVLVGGAPTPMPGLVRAAVAIGGCLVLAAGVVTVLRGPAWTSLSGRYETPRSGSDQDRPAPADDWWQALDRGEDPTG